MPKYYNSNDAYGDEGPFESESKEALADGMMPTFREWHLQQRGIVVVQSVEEMRAEYISGLTEVDEG